MIKYEINIDKKSINNSERFILGNINKKNLFIVGLNPSTADAIKPDLTLKKVIKFAEQNNYDGFVMLNLYPKRATLPKDLPEIDSEKLVAENIKQISSILEEYKGADILASWGETVEIRDYLKTSIAKIKELGQKYNCNWYKIGELTKSGHPRHPSRISYDTKFTKFDIENYKI